MRTKVTLILLFLNVALFFFIFGFERKWGTEEIAREARRRVLGPETDNIQSLEITGPTLAAPIRLLRDGDNWRITSPYEWPASPYAVGRIVSELRMLEHETSFPVANLGATDLSLADYGLAEPALRVSFSAGTDPSAAPVTLALGKKTDIGNRLYVLSPDGSRVHVVNQSLADSLSLNLDQLRAPECFTIPVYEARSLNLQSAGPANVRVRLRREGNRWKFESPIDARADKRATETAILGLNNLQVRTFLGSPSARPELLTRAAIAAPALRITLEGTNRRETLLLGAEVTPTADAPPAGGREFHAQIEDRDAVFTIVIPDELATTLRNAQVRLRDPLVLDLESRRIDAVTLADASGAEVILQQLESAAGWQVVQSRADGTVRTYPADRTVVETGLLHELSRLSARTFERDVPTDAELETWGLTRPARTITLAFKPEPGAVAAVDTAATLLLGTDPTGAQTFAKLRQQTFVYGVDRAILDATPVDPLHYRDRLLRELPAGVRLAGITLRDLTRNTVLFEHTLAAGETWDTVFAAAPADRQTALRQLRLQLRTLRAQSFVADTFGDRVEVNGEMRGWRFRLDARLALTGDAVDQLVDSTLFLADRDGGDRQLVGSPEFDVVFEAEQPLLDAIWTLSYADRDPGPVTPTPPPASMPEPAPAPTS